LPSIAARSRFEKEISPDAPLCRTPEPPAFSMLAVLAMAAGACGHGGPAPHSPTSEGARSGGCPLGPASSSPSIRRAREGRSSSRRPAVADEDAKAILTIDVDAKKELAETRVGGAPSQVYGTKDGRVLVTVRDKNKLLAMRPSPG
jgi:hypothetical protein